MRDWAKAKGYDTLNLDALTEEFVDYWGDVAGAKGVKLDWLGTWRNWVRRKSQDDNVRPMRQPTSDVMAAIPTVEEIVAARDWGPPCDECERQGGQHFRGCSKAAS